MEALLEKALNTIPILLAIAIGSGIGAFYFFRYFREENKLLSEEERRIMNLQDADRDALLSTLTEELKDRRATIQNLIDINKSLRHKIGIFNELDNLNDKPNLDN